eukprot:1493196-Rhodomonas_salina.1
MTSDGAHSRNQAKCSLAVRFVPDVSSRLPLLLAARDSAVRSLRLPETDLRLHSLARMLSQLEQRCCRVTMMMTVTSVFPAAGNFATWPTPSVSLVLSSLGPGPSEVSVLHRLRGQRIGAASGWQLQCCHRGSDTTCPTSSRSTELVCGLRPACPPQLLCGSVVNAVP